MSDLGPAPRSCRRYNTKSDLTPGCVRLQRLHLNASANDRSRVSRRKRVSTLGLCLELSVARAIPLLARPDHPRQGERLRECAAS
jgi:hypothetical protein